MSVLSKASLVLSLAMLSAVPSAFGQTETNRNIAVSVVPLAPKATYTTATETYLVGYSVTVKNEGNNNVNNIQFLGTTSVTDPEEKAVFSSTNASFCPTPMQGSVTINCTVGTLNAGQSVTFAVTFVAPVKVVNSFNDDDGTDFVNFTGYVYFAEGTSDNPNSTPQNDTRTWSAFPAVTLGTQSTTQIISALNPTGGTFYTGAELLTNAADQFAIRVFVPGQDKYSTVKLNERSGISPVDCSARKNFITCYEAEVFVTDVVFPDGGDNWLEIKLLVDASNLLPSAKINRVLIQYDDRPEGSTDSPNLYAVGPCPVINGVARPLTGVEYGKPCLAESRAVGGSTKGKVKTPPNWLFTLLNYKNGRFPLQ